MFIQKINAKTIKTDFTGFLLWFLILLQDDTRKYIITTTIYKTKTYTIEIDIFIKLTETK